MRILFLTDHFLDYTTDPLYLGLSRVLGNERVIDYPYKASFHEKEYVPWYLVPREGKQFSREEILEGLRAKQFDMVCVGSFRQECLRELSELYQKVAFPPVVYVDGSDDARIRHELVSQYKIRVYFKRDFVWNLGSPLGDRLSVMMSFRGNRGLFSRTFPLPLSLVQETLPAFGALERDIDVSFRGRASHPRRVKAVELLSTMAGVRFSGGIYASPGDRKYKLVAGRMRRLWTKLVDNAPAARDACEAKMGPESYYREMASSKIAVALRGGGRTASLRYYEIVAMGAMLLSDAPETLIPNDFVNGRHAVFCRSDLRDLPDLVRYYLRNDQERQAICAEAHAHLLKYHTCERRAEYFLNICQRFL